MKATLLLISTALASVCFSGQSFAQTAPVPIPASRVYYCGGGVEAYSIANQACYYNTQSIGRVDHSDIAGWPTPQRKPNYYYDDQKGNYVGNLMSNQFNVEIPGIHDSTQIDSYHTADQEEKLVIACPSGTKPSSATILGTPVAIQGSGTNLTFNPALVTTLQPVVFMCS